MSRSTMPAYWRFSGALLLVVALALPAGAAPAGARGAGWWEELWGWVVGRVEAGHEFDPGGRLGPRSTANSGDAGWNTDHDGKSDAGWASDPNGSPAPPAARSHVDAGPDLDPNGR